MILTRSEVLEHLRRMADGFESGDTLEGSFAFYYVNRDGWAVEGSYRVGNLHGQGGVVMIQGGGDE